MKHKYTKLKHCSYDTHQLKFLSMCCSIVIPKADRSLATVILDKSANKNKSLCYMILLLMNFWQTTIRPYYKKTLILSIATLRNRKTSLGFSKKLRCYTGNYLAFCSLPKIHKTDSFFKSNI